MERLNDQAPVVVTRKSWKNSKGKTIKERSVKVVMQLILPFLFLLFLHFCLKTAENVQTKVLLYSPLTQYLITLLTYSNSLSLFLSVFLQMFASLPYRHPSLNGSTSTTKPPEAKMSSNRPSLLWAQHSLNSTSIGKQVCVLDSIFRISHSQNLRVQHIKIALTVFVQRTTRRSSLSL